MNKLYISSAFAIGFLCLTVGESKADEIQLPLLSKSHHVPAGNFNEHHRIIGIGYETERTGYTAQYYRDSYDRGSFLLSRTSRSQRIWGISGLAEFGLTTKGTQLGADEPVKMRLVPFVQIGARVDIDLVYFKLGYVPVPKTLGSSVLTLTTGFRIPL